MTFQLYELWFPSSNMLPCRRAKLDKTIEQPFKAIAGTITEICPQRPLGRFVVAQLDTDEDSLHVPPPSPRTTLITAAAHGWDNVVIQYFPSIGEADEAIPERARTYLSQALDSLSAPSGAVMLAASSVDAMLKAKDLKTGSLYSRIDEAVTTNLITPEMAQWAHDVRLDANDERHADENALLPSLDDARRAVDFATALGQFMFVLPARVKRGIAAATGR